MAASWLSMDDYFKDPTVDATAILAPCSTSDSRLDLNSDAAANDLLFTLFTTTDWLQM